MSLLLNPLLITIRFILLFQTRPLMFHRKNYKTTTEKALLPTELWLVIFDLVIEDGIIRLDQCDHTIFPYIWATFFASARDFQSFDSYCQLRLVCRRFNSLLGAPPLQEFSDSTSSPCPISTRALSFNFKTLSQPHFQRLLAGTSTCDRVVYLDVKCNLFEDLSDFLRAARAFRNIQRLTLRLVNWPSDARPRVVFWADLPRIFPYLVTLALVTTHPWVPLKVGAREEVVSFERLEILYFNGVVRYSGSRFPRLRHASIWDCSLRELGILTRSPHLESLLIRSCHGISDIDVTSCLHLKLLGVPIHLSGALVPLGDEHDVECIWLYCHPSVREIKLSEQLSRNFPKVRRITMEFSLLDLRYLQQDIRGMKLDSFRLSTKPSPYGERFLVFEPELVATEEKGGVLRKVRRKMRW